MDLLFFDGLVVVLLVFVVLLVLFEVVFVVLFDLGLVFDCLCVCMFVFDSCVFEYWLKCLVCCMIGFMIDGSGLLIIVLCWVMFVDIEVVIVEK